MSQKVRVIPGEKQHFSDPSFLNGNGEYGVYASYLAQIIECSQQLYGVNDDIEAHLANTIASMTHDRAQLYLHRQSISSTIMMPLIPGRRGFLVRWGEVVYGSLQVSWPDRSYDQFVLPAALCERLAYDCGWCLHVLEIERLRLQQTQWSDEDAQQKVQGLSASELEVLKLMVKGFSTRTIAETLQVSKRTIETHQRHIYQLLDVHSQREAILIGLAAGMALS
ncbi:MAG TPA: helix-turn-helix transcriptional regulator [Ktedonosporobacter sp.]|nr:helix-turn-helix transcriptional regulator [Ktedonosporobacter sp.]